MLSQKRRKDGRKEKYHMLEAGIRGRMEIEVTPELTAAKIGSGLAEVYATPYMIALIENTAWSSIADRLAEGEGTVGTKICVEHLAATPVGMKVRCETELTEVDRRRLVFQVEVYDETGKIGTGTHERFIINNEKFFAKANAKAALVRGNVQ